MSKSTPSLIHRNTNRSKLSNEHLSMCTSLGTCVCISNRQPEEHFFRWSGEVSKVWLRSHLCNSFASGDLGVGLSAKSVKSLNGFWWKHLVRLPVPPLSLSVGPGRAGKKNVLKSIEMTCMWSEVVKWHEINLMELWHCFEKHVRFMSPGSAANALFDEGL